MVAWADAIRRADGLIIVSPEYNWSIPGGLKNAIDWVSRMKEQPFKDKPVALQSAAGGILGGSRMQYHLRQSLISVDAILFGRPEVIVTFAAQKFDGKTLELKDQTAIDLIRQQLAGFEKFIRRLRTEVIPCPDCPAARPSSPAGPRGSAGIIRARLPPRARV